MQTIDVHKITRIQPVTVQFGYREDGEFIMEECNHAGSEVVEVDDMELQNDGSYNYAPTGTAYERRCNKCPAWYNNATGEWETA